MFKYGDKNVKPLFAFAEQDRFTTPFMLLKTGHTPALFSFQNHHFHGPILSVHAGCGCPLCIIHQSQRNSKNKNENSATFSGKF